MAKTQLTTDQYMDASITSAKLASNISITNLTAANILSGNCSLVSGNSLTLNGSSLTNAAGYIFRYNGVDMAHIDGTGNMYIKGNLEIGGELNSTTTTINTMEVADYEIILNSSVTSPYASGGRLTVNRGGTNYDPYIGWDETNQMWKLKDGTNEARLVDIAYGDTRYLKLAGGAMAGILALNNYKMHLRSATDVNHYIVHQQYQDDGTTQIDGPRIAGYQGIELYRTINSQQMAKFTATGMTLTGDATISGDIVVNGSKITFGNGSTISNETDALFDITGDGLMRLYGTSSGNRIEIDSSSLYHTITGDAHGWFQIDGANRKLAFGPGSAIRDTWLYRNGVGALRTDGSLTAGGPIVIDKSIGGDGTWDDSGLIIRNLNADPGECAVSYQNISTGTNYWITGINQDNYYHIAYGTGFVGANIKFTIDNNGNTSIGTQNPSAKLHIEGGDIKLAKVAGAATHTLSSYASGTSFWIMGVASGVQDFVIADTQGWDRSVSINYAAGTTGAAAGLLKIGQLQKDNTNWTHGITAFYTNGAERMRIDSSGNVGIGTTPLVAANNHTLTMDGTAGSLVEFRTGGSIPMRVGSDSTSGYLWAPNANAIRIGTNSTERMRILSDGKVGIGPSDPGELLEVGGNIKTSGSIRVADTSRVNKFDIVYSATTKSLEFNFVG